MEAGKRFQQERGVNRPAFDFFNYTGINRPVRLCATPVNYIRDVTLVPALDGTVSYQVKTAGEGRVTIEILDTKGQMVTSATGAEGTVKIDRPHLREPRPGTPYL